MAISFMRALEGVTGVDILGRGQESPEDVERRVALHKRLAAGVDPWLRWRVLEREVLQAGQVVMLDGATGTEIERLAGPESMSALGWSCSANFTYPDVVKQVHYQYLAAGSDIIISNTYATNGNVMQGANMGRVSGSCTKAAVRIAQEARAEYLEDNPSVQRDPLIAGSLSCHPPKQEEGSCFDGGEWPDPMTEIENNQAHCKVLVEAGVDILFVEMLWETEHGERAVKAACDTNLPVVLCLACPIQENTSVMTAVRGQLACNQPLKLGGLGDVTLSAAIQRFTAGRANIVAICIHHTPLTLMPHAISAARSAWPGYLGAYPEHGTFEMPHWKYEKLPTEELVGHAEVWIQGSGVNMIGGCCGVGPRHIEALSAAFKKNPADIPPEGHPAAELVKPTAAPALSGPPPALPLPPTPFQDGPTTTTTVPTEAVPAPTLAASPGEFQPAPKDDITAEYIPPPPPPVFPAGVSASHSVVSASATPCSDSPSPDLVVATPSVSEVTTKTPSPEPASPEDVPKEAPGTFQAPPVAAQFQAPPPVENVPEVVQNVPGVSEVQLPQPPGFEPPAAPEEVQKPAETRSLSPLSMLLQGLPKRDITGPSNALAAFAAMSDAKIPKDETPEPRLPPPPVHFDPLGGTELPSEAKSHSD